VLALEGIAEYDFPGDRKVRSHIVRIATASGCY